VKSLLLAHRRTLQIVAVVVPILMLFAYAALRSGPLASVAVTVASVEVRALNPALFGVGLVEARYTHRIGPTAAGRVLRVEVQPGDRVSVGQLLAEIDPIDLDDRVDAQKAAVQRAAAATRSAQAQQREAQARQSLAAEQARRHDELLARQLISKELADVKRQELGVAQAALAAARANVEAALQESSRLESELHGGQRQRDNLRLLSPIDGLVTRRDADAGSTLVAGQTLIEVVEPQSIWIHVRFDQSRAAGLKAGLPASIVLRSLAQTAIDGRVARIEPLADAVTEEILAKVDIVSALAAPPPIGELAEVTVTLAATAPLPTVANASVQRVDGQLGVWLLADGELRFAPVELGVGDLDGRVQIKSGLAGGEQVIVYSQKALRAGSRIHVVDQIVRAAP
jgi:RND family efflux transporter MFP subunit